MFVLCDRPGESSLVGDKVITQSITHHTRQTNPDCFRLTVVTVRANNFHFYFPFKFPLLIHFVCLKMFHSAYCINHSELLSWRVLQQVRQLAIGP